MSRWSVISYQYLLPEPVRISLKIQKASSFWAGRPLVWVLRWLWPENWWISRHENCAKAQKMRKGIKNCVKAPGKSQGSRNASNHQEFFGDLEMRQGTKNASRHEECAKTRKMRQRSRNASRHKKCVRRIENRVKAPGKRQGTGNEPKVREECIRNA